jgi:O-antigen/teichoic acid export membrane protein
MSKVLKNTFIYLLGSIIPKMSGFILLPIYAAYLTPSDYGIINSIQSLNQLFIILFSLSLPAAIYRLYWDYQSQIKEFLSTIFWAVLILSSAVLITSLLFSNILNKMFASITFYPYFFLGLLTFYIVNFYDLPNRQLILSERPKRFITLSLSKYFLNAGLVLSLVVYKGYGAYGYLLGNLISAIIILPFYLKILQKQLIVRLNFKILKNVTKYSLPLIPTFLVVWVMDFSDRIFIERYNGLADVGIYSLAYTISGLVLILSGAWESSFRPLFFKIANTYEELEAKEKIYVYNNNYIIIFLFICFSIVFFSKDLVLLLFDTRYHKSHEFIPILVLAYFFSVLGGMTNRFFEQSKKTRLNMYLQFLGGIINIGLNFILIANYGILGAALSTMITFAFVFILGYFYSKKYCFFVKFNWRLILTMSFVFISLTAFFNYYLEIDKVILLCIKIVTYISVFSFMLYKYFPSIYNVLMKKDDV